MNVWEPGCSRLPLAELRKGSLTNLYHTTLAKDEFVEWSKSYDKSILQWLLFGPSHRAVIKRLKSQFGDRPFRVLDVGCGTGVFAERMRTALPNAEVWGVDLVSAMLDKGRPRYAEHAGHIIPIQGDSERLPFASASFNVVTCCNSFHHYPHQDRAVSEMRRVLVSGGKLMLIDGFRDRPWGWLIYDVCVAGVEGAVHHCSAKRFRDLLQNAGFIEHNQKRQPGFAPFIFNEASAPAIVPMPHIGVSTDPSQKSRVMAEAAGQRRS